MMNLALIVSDRDLTKQDLQADEVENYAKVKMKMGLNTMKFPTNAPRPTAASRDMVN